MTWCQSVGHIGPVLKPRCIGTESAGTQLLFYSILLLKPLVHETFPAYLVLLDSICLIMLYKT